MEEFTTEQRQNLNDAAAEFRNKQRLLLENQAVPSRGDRTSRNYRPRPLN
jgi:hypothetical protein